jgi:hypothetical protein
MKTAFLFSLSSVIFALVRFGKKSEKYFHENEHLRASVTACVFFCNFKFYDCFSQCCGPETGSTGSTYFWASWIRIH